MIEIYRSISEDDPHFMSTQIVKPNLKIVLLFEKQSKTPNNKLTLENIADEIYQQLQQEQHPPQDLVKSKIIIKYF